jgi:hypothetical protein
MRIMLPDYVQTIINQIIAATPDVTPELRGALQDELQEQFDQLLLQTIIEQLPTDQADAFNQLLATQPQPDPDAAQKFLADHQLNRDTLMQQAADRLKAQYLD